MHHLGYYTGTCPFALDLETNRRGSPRRMHATRSLPLRRDSTWNSDVDSVSSVRHRRRGEKARIQSSKAGEARAN